MKLKSVWLLCLLFIYADNPDVIYDESRVPDYTLPDPLVCLDGSRVTTVQDWETKRRPEILNLFTEQVYGKAPQAKGTLRYKVLEQSKAALNGKAERKQVRIFFSPDEQPYMDLLVYKPLNTTAPLAGFVGTNFGGNQTVVNDPAIFITESWIMNNENLGIENHRATEATRGTATGRWPVETIIDRGYFVATYYYGDVDPDFDDFSNGIHPLFYKDGQTQPAPDEWGSIAAWAWGLSRAYDYLARNEDHIDSTRIVVLGHSRLGKTAVWAGAADPRFAAVISNNSGCGGAALSRRHFGETVKRINTVFPHWFCDNFNSYNDNEGALPVDQHELIALIAPRPVYIASAVEDRWADPKGEFLSGKFASPVYQLYGLDGLAADEQPPIEQPVTSIIGYHIRNGKHNITQYDWERYLDFIDKYLAN